MNGRPCRVCLEDDHPVVEAGLRQLVADEHDLVLERAFSSPGSAMSGLRGHDVHVVVVDYHFDGPVSGVELCRTLSGAGYGLTCLGFSAASRPRVVGEFLDAGAHGFISKLAPPRQILDALRAVARGDRYVDATIPAEAPGHGAPVLAPQERRVLDHIAAGLSNREIAARLHISTGTAKSYVSHVLHKLQVSHRAQAVAVASRYGLLAESE